MYKYEVKHYTNVTSEGRFYGTIETTTIPNVVKCEKEKGLIRLTDSNGNAYTYLQPAVLSCKKIEGV